MCLMAQMTRKFILYHNKCHSLFNDVRLSEVLYRTWQRCHGQIELICLDMVYDINFRIGSM